MHRAPARSGGGPRPVSRPGVSGNGDSGFMSPFQPPPGYDDLAADVDRDAWHEITVAGDVWHVKVPDATAVHVLTIATSRHQKDNRRKLRATHDFIQRYMRPEDFLYMLSRMANPDDKCPDLLDDMLAGIATVGTARPFLRSRVW